MALSIVWRHPDRHEVELRLHTQVRWMHIRGWRQLVVAVVFMGPVFVGVELAPEASEQDAHDWAALFDARYRVDLTVADLVAQASTFSEFYAGPGVGAFLNRVEWEQQRQEQERRRRRERPHGRGPPPKRR